MRSFFCNRVVVLKITVALATLLTIPFEPILKEVNPITLGNQFETVSESHLSKIRPLLSKVYN